MPAVYITAKLHGLEPYQYINAVFSALPYTKTVEELEKLLSWNVKTTQE
ncbi:MAG: hypothetical protein COB83_13355 [Gammaproteobacteria bacterium]|nr:MAG: hypothetical protein COB83_13355 [Gammaproteobacteria bacterium]